MIGRTATHRTVRPEGRPLPRDSEETPGHPRREASIALLQQHYAGLGHVDLSKPDPHPKPPWPPKSPEKVTTRRAVVSADGGSYESAIDAHKQTGVPKCLIYYSCRHPGKQRAHGQHWYYRDQAPAEVLAMVAARGAAA